MNKWNLIVDVALCENCNNCMLAAKDEFVGNDFPGYSAPHSPQGRGVIHIERKVRGAAPLVDAAHLPKMCNHCDDAPCMKVSNEGAVKKRDDGIVLFDPIKARGRRDLVDACPYGAVVWNEELQLPQTWFFDAHLLDSGVAAPRCVGVCPTKAMEAVKVSDESMTLRATQEGLRTLQPELRTRPRVYYKNLHRIDHCFVAGSVTATIGERVECVQDALVVLQRPGQEEVRTTTDAFGDFRLDALPQLSGNAVVRVSHQQLGQAERLVDIQTESVVLDDLRLKA
jgi:Fe-S-cluster-containing dehydrogenase component